MATGLENAVADGRYLSRECLLVAPYKQQIINDDGDDDKNMGSSSTLESTEEMKLAFP